jgi:hypothetical protein
MICQGLHTSDTRRPVPHPYGAVVLAWTYFPEASTRNVGGVLLTTMIV